jgi:adenylate kinase family enzyme
VSVELVPERAAAALRGCRRLLILGNCGAGKSTLGRHLAPRLGLPLIALDREFWQPGWVESEAAAWRERRVPELIAGEEWIIEGQYTSTLALRLTRADAVLHLDLPRLVSVVRVLSRVLFPGPRPDLPARCPERLDPSFLSYVWTNQDRLRPLVLDLLDEAAARIPVGRLRDAPQVERFLEALCA